MKALVFSVLAGSAIFFYLEANPIEDKLLTVR
jgi:hypothetical protein